MKRNALLTMSIILVAGLGIIGVATSWGEAQEKIQPTIAPNETSDLPESSESVEPVETNDDADSPEVLAPGSFLPEATAPVSHNSVANQLPRLPGNALLNMELRSLRLGGAEYNHDHTMITTATKRPQMASEVPGSITIITEEEIRKKGAWTLHELLLHFTSAQFDYSMIKEHLRFRGMEATHNNKILIMVNGRKINSVDWGNFETQFGTNLDMVKQIEIIKGPGSSLYGANAFSGVINIITKTGADIQGINTKLSVGVKSQMDSPSAYTLITFGKHYNDFDLLGTAGYWNQLMFDPINGVTPNNDYTGAQLDASIIYKDIVRFQAGYQKIEMPLMGSYDYSSEFDREYHAISYADLNYQIYQSSMSGLSLRLFDTYDANDLIKHMNYNIPTTKINSLADLPSGAVTVVDDNGVQTPLTDTIGNYYTDVNSAISLMQGGNRALVTSGGPKNEVLSEIQWNLSWPENNYLVTGLSLAYDWSQGDYNQRESVSDQNYAFYIQDEMHFTDNLICLAGARLDYNLDYEQCITPRASMVYAPLEGLRLKALYGSAFRAPSIAERFTRVQYGISLAQGNEDLKPEKIKESEVSCEYSFGQWLQTKAVYFYWETEDEIVTDFSSEKVYVYADNLSTQTGHAEFPNTAGLYYPLLLNLAAPNYTWKNANSRIGRGYEMETTFHPLSFLSLDLNYSHFYQFARQNLVLPTAWACGDVDIFNADLSADWGNQFFAHLYAHVDSSPKSIARSFADRKTRFTEYRLLQQYDLSFGGKIKEILVTITFFNFLESENYFDCNSNQYIAGPKIFRIIADYTYHF